MQSNITLIITSFAWNWLFHRILKHSITVVTHYMIVLWYSFSIQNKKSFKSCCFAKIKTVAKEKYWINLFWINLKYFTKIATTKMPMFIWIMLSPISLKNLELNALQCSNRTMDVHFLLIQKLHFISLYTYLIYHELHLPKQLSRSTVPENFFYVILPGYLWY